MYRRTFRKLCLGPGKTHVQKCLEKSSAFTWDCSLGSEQALLCGEGVSHHKERWLFCLLFWLCYLLLLFFSSWYTKKISIKNSTEKETQMYRTDFWTLWEKAEGGMFRENSIQTCILSRVITSPGWMHETSAQAWCTGKTQRDQVEREVAGEIGMGHTCKSMANSCQCMTKTPIIL